MNNIYLYESQNYSPFIQNLIEILDSASEPLTVSEILDRLDPGVTSAKVPRNSVSTRLNEYSDNSPQSRKTPPHFFTIVSTNPLKFWSLSRIDELGMNKTIPAASQNFDDSTRSINPFKQSICIIGESGVGKSVTIRNILSHEGHKFDFIIPSALSGGLLVQYSPADSEYKLSKLGNMIVDAYRDPSNNYTMVIDEMHKSHVIEMINDELLQAISTKRNKYRFVSLDPEATDLFVKELGRDILKAGNVRIPDNFGILFISSKDKVIINNEDFFNRVDLVFLDESDRSMKTARDLENKVLSDEEKKSLREN